MDSISNIKEITLYSNGDSRKLSTWSNVPYLFAQALENAGIKINRVNIEAPRRLNRLYNTFFYHLFRTIFRQKTSPTFYRSPFHRWIINRRLRNAAKKYHKSDLNLFLSYLFINKYSDKPNIVWCDWTDRIVIQRLGRKPAWHERWSLQQEDKAISKADLRYTMFPVCKRKMEKQYDVEFRYLNRNVVNTVYPTMPDFDLLIKNRYASNEIIFIGNHLYLHAARKLVKAYKELRNNYPDLQLNIIGLTPRQIPEANFEGITCYGYLHKDNIKESEQYYQLLLNARVFVNPASQWGGYSSTIEAMYYGCPVVVSPYEDFVEDFGLNISFGIYHLNNLKKEIAKILSLDRDSYIKMAQDARNKVKSYTWDNYVHCFLNDVSHSLLKTLAE
ncbi:MAG: glycosyltransferase [Lachnospiraceae bacterium]|nr:glycosyltransferase [Lachnospiraceae bacterium]